MLKNNVLRQFMLMQPNLSAFSEESRGIFNGRKKHRGVLHTQGVTNPSPWIPFPWIPGNFRLNSVALDCGILP
jgi:hypothetical protein